jgi:hypothetical protein
VGGKAAQASFKDMKGGLEGYERVDVEARQEVWGPAAQNVPRRREMKWGLVMVTQQEVVAQR